METIKALKEENFYELANTCKRENIEEAKEEFVEFDAVCAIIAELGRVVDHVTDWRIDRAEELRRMNLTIEKQIKQMEFVKSFILQLQDIHSQNENQFVGEDNNEEDEE